MMAPRGTALAMLTAMNHVLWIAFVLASTSLVAAQGVAPSSRCADCHFARPEAPGQHHLFEWDRSPHGRNRVGCESCHGGDATTFEPFVAHRDIVPSAEAKSPLSRAQLPATCGRCHVGPFVAFQRSTHYALLMDGDRRGPTCSTCHGEVDGRLLSPRGLESKCSSCHGPGEAAPRAERARAARADYEALGVAREELKLVRSLIRRIDDRRRRTELDEAYRQAEVPLIEAVNAGHRFVYDDMHERLNVAQQRIEALLGRLATPSVPR